MTERVNPGRELIDNLSPESLESLSRAAVLSSYIADLADVKMAQDRAQSETPSLERQDLQLPPPRGSSHELKRRLLTPEPEQKETNGGTIKGLPSEPPIPSGD